ncbi:MAG: pyridoxamine 5'-phosphate oxidase family protein [Acidimicrobiales bacterium]|nr:pyridoxamine 5'-phosphate oxidase family protein [Acidimicrobiales bacterium]
MEFTDTITTVDQLRELLAPPSEFVTEKESDTLDDHSRDFIGRSPFVLIASTDAEGRVDISPKGDPPGFVRVLDDTTIAIPDRPGNHRADTFENVLRHPFVSVIFLVPGTKFTLRIRGRASIVRDAWLRESMTVGGRTPEFALAIDLTTAFFHCGKCIIRSELWSSADGLGGRDERLLAEAMASQLADIVTTDEMHEIILDDEAKRLY